MSHHHKPGKQYLVKQTMPPSRLDPLKQFANNIVPTVVKTRLINRNSKCPCGSGQKYRKCCMMRIARGEGFQGQVSSG